MIRVGVIYKASYSFASPTHHNQYIRNFFMNAMPRNKDIELSYFAVKDHIDVTKKKKSVDVIVLMEDTSIALPILENIHESKIPVISGVGDAHKVITENRLVNKEACNISYYFAAMPLEYFYQHYPKTSKCKSIMYGVEPKVYGTITPFQKRIKKKIINSGYAGYKLSTLWKLRKFASINILHRRKKVIDPGKPHIPIHYKLRTLCNDLKYVDYNVTKKYKGNDYPALLSKYQAGIAATTTTPTAKYLEIPASGCLTFMEVTKLNRAKCLGFTDGVNAVFINEDNYKDKFEEYLADINNPKWEKIANAGREYVLNNYTNDIAVKRLIEIIKEVIQ